jgi:hypothetical protein
MATGCVTTMRDKNGEVLAAVYRHVDGNPAEHGRWLLNTVIEHARGEEPAEDGTFACPTFAFLAAHVVAGLVDQYRLTPMTWAVAHENGVTEGEWEGAPTWYDPAADDDGDDDEMRVVRCRLEDTITVGLLPPGTFYGQLWEYQLHQTPSDRLIVSARSVGYHHAKGPVYGTWLPLTDVLAEFAR